MWHRAAALLTALLPVHAADALDLEYVSHLGLYRPEIGLTEPSGLAVDPDGSGFWIVSDEAETVFRLKANGDLAAFSGRDERMHDLEGVEIDAKAGRLLLISERTASIVTVATAPPHRLAIIDVAGLPGPVDLRDVLADRRNGLEGIAVHPGTRTVIVLKEDAPRLLIELAPDLDRVVEVRDLDDVLPGDEDVSGLAFDLGRDGLWIVSDTGRAIHFLPGSAGPPQTAALTWRDGDRLRPLDNPEGVAFSPDGLSLFVVTDDGRDSKLVQYEVQSEP